MTETGTYLFGGTPMARRRFALPRLPGVYGLYVQRETALSIKGLSKLQPIYIGSASGRGGLAGRCHFNARTANHSPRKSLAVLQMQSLRLRPVLVSKPNSPPTWGLDPASDATLTEWMHSELAMGWAVTLAGIANRMISGVATDN